MATKRFKPKMARSRTRSIRRGAKRVFSRRGLGKANSLFRNGAAGIGGGEIAEQMVARVSPQFAPIASVAGAYLAGGTEGVVGKMIFDVVTGGGGLLSGLGLGQVQTNAPTTEVI